jgi:predicted ester cyclase
MPAIFTEENKAVVRKFFEEVWNAGSLLPVGHYLSVGYLEHSPLPGQIPGFEGAKQVMAMFFRAFPDLSIEFTHLDAEGERVFVKCLLRGTHQGAILGVQPTGRLVEVNESHIYRLKAERIVEHWGGRENLSSLMQQLLAVPTPELGRLDYAQLV